MLSLVDCTRSDALQLLQMPPYGASVPLQGRADHFSDGISQASKRNFFAISGKPVDTIVDQVSAALPAAAA